MGTAVIQDSSAADDAVLSLSDLDLVAGGAPQGMDDPDDGDGIDNKGD